MPIRDFVPAVLTVRLTLNFRLGMITPALVPR